VQRLCLQVAMDTAIWVAVRRSLQRLICAMMHGPTGANVIRKLTRSSRLDMSLGQPQSMITKRFSYVHRTASGRHHAYPATRTIYVLLEARASHPVTSTGAITLGATVIARVQVSENSFDHSSLVRLIWYARLCYGVLVGSNRPQMSAASIPTLFSYHRGGN